MLINWEEIDTNKSHELINPREIYSTLEGRKWDRLRPEQTEVLDAWFGRRTEKDLVIKQNTGSGKTLTGLLVALSSMNEGAGPAVYLVPDSYLIDQVLQEAQNAKIAAVRDEKDFDFQSSRSILVTTFHKLFNGKSVFGVKGSKLANVKLGTIVIDDAHTAISTTESQFSVQIRSDDPLFDEVLRLFDADLKKQGPKAYADIKDGQPGGPIRVSFKTVAEHADELMSMISPHTRNPNTNADLYFRWDLVANVLSYCTVTVTSQEIEIRPPCPDVEMLVGFKQAKRRVYLTATLENESVLVTELDADATSVNTPITPKNASDLGDRIILAPLELNPRLDYAKIQEMVRTFADTPGSKNVVVLVPSDKDAERWSRFADAILHVDDMRPTLSEMQSGKYIGLVVLVNKYDGVDLPGDACRILVIDGVPTPTSPHDRRMWEALNESPTYRARQVQKIEQGMGRGTRDIGDYCAVLLLTSEAALSVYNPELRQLYSPATRAQIELSYKVSEQIRGAGIEAVAELIHIFLNRDPQWTQRSLKNTANVGYDAGNSISSLAIARRAAFNLMRNGETHQAIDRLQHGIDSLYASSEKGWYMEELATYQQHVSPVRAQQTLISAKRMNSTVLTPEIRPEPRQKKKKVLDQASNAMKFLRQYDSAVEMQLAIASIFEKIVWGVENSASRAEEQFRQLGLILGFESSRPDKEDSDGGPDNLWRMPEDRFVVIELKTEITRHEPTIIKAEAEQLGHSTIWLNSKYGQSAVCLPVLVHPSCVMAREAHLPAEARVMTQDKFETFKSSVTTYIKEMAESDDWTSRDNVASGLRRNNLLAEELIPRHTKMPRTRRL